MSDEKTGQGLVDYLRETGTGENRLLLMEAWLKAFAQTESRPATARETLDWMCDPDSPLAEFQGTVLKAGKWVVGNTFYLAKPGVSGSDQLAAEREEWAKKEATYKQDIAIREAEIRRMRRAQEDLQQRCERLQDQLATRSLAVDEDDRPNKGRRGPKTIGGLTDIGRKLEEVSG